MATTYYGGAQFQQLQEQRDHEDTFSAEVIVASAITGLDFGEFVVEDVLRGNTATLRKYRKKMTNTQFVPVVINGMVHPDQPDLDHGFIENHDFFGLSPIKDDYSIAAGVNGYWQMDETDERRIDTLTCVDALSVNFEDVSEKILNPENPMPVYEADGTTYTPQFAPYGQNWEDSPELQAEYPLLGDYAAFVDMEWQNQQDDISNITDVYIGIFATANTINEANRVALYFTFERLLPQITFNGYDVDVIDLSSSGYMYQMNSGGIHGEFTIVNGFQGWSHIIRYGEVTNEFEEDRTRKYKSSHEIVVNLNDDPPPYRRTTDGDPIHQIIYGNPELEATWGSDPIDVTIGGRTLLEIHVQLPDLPDGRKIYGEIRLFDIQTMHVITTGTGNVAIISGGLSGASSPNPDGPVFTSPSGMSVAEGVVDVGTVITTSDHMPVTYALGSGFNSYDIVIDPNTGVLTFGTPPVYGGATFDTVYVITEATDADGNMSAQKQIITITGDTTPIPPHNPAPIWWVDYISGGSEPGEDGYADIVFFPISYFSVKKLPIFRRERFLRESVQVGIYSITAITTEWYESKTFKVILFVIVMIIAVIIENPTLANLAKVIITTAVQMVAGIVIGKILMSITDNAWVQFIVMALIGVATGQIDTSSFMDAAKLAMEATNTYLKHEMAEKLAELQKEVEAFEKRVKAAEEELRQLEEEAGIESKTEPDIWFKLMTTVGLVESPEAAESRSLDVGNALDNNVDSKVDVHMLMPEMLR